MHLQILVEKRYRAKRTKGPEPYFHQTLYQFLYNIALQKQCGIPFSVYIRIGNSCR